MMVVYGVEQNLIKKQKKKILIKNIDLNLCNLHKDWGWMHQLKP